MTQIDPGYERVTPDTEEGRKVKTMLFALNKWQDDNDFINELVAEIELEWNHRKQISRNQFNSLEKLFKRLC
jgi:hypothetical protein